VRVEGPLSIGMRDSAGSSVGAGRFRVVTVSSNKGGVGKTTIATNLAVHFRAQRPDVPVLLLSLDDQSLLDRMFAVPGSPGALGDAATIESAWRRGSLAGAIVPGRYGVHYVPTSSGIASLKREVRNPFVLSKILERTGWEGLIVVDTKSDLEILSQNAIAASDLAVVVAADHSSLVEAEKVFELLRSVGRPRDAGRILLSLVDLRVKYREGEDRDVLAVLVGEIRRRGLPLFEGFISRSPKIESLYTNAEGRAYSVLHEAKTSLINRQFAQLAHDVLAVLDELPAPDRARAAAPRAWEPVTTAPVEPERRRETRRAYRRPVAAFRSRTPPVLSLTARDLSGSGIGLEAFGDVELGERLHVGLEPRVDADPLLVWGSVARISGPGRAPASMGVVFDPPAPEVERRLRALLERLPEASGSPSGASV